LIRVICGRNDSLFDIGNTHTHIGLANDRRVVKQINVPTREWFGGKAAALVKKFVGGTKITGAVLCSVVPRATPLVKEHVRALLEAGRAGTDAENRARRGH
jgi:pantothenate kinase type III